MSELDNKPYGVSFIASAPEDFAFELQDIVEVVDAHEDLYLQKGRVVGICRDKTITVSFDGYIFDFKADQLRKIPDTISSEDDSDNVKAFKAILNEMAETYKAKDSTYGNAYQDGFNRFGAVQLVSRMYEKYCRIENLLARNADNKVPDESVLDTLTDLAVQAICLRMLLQKNDFENVN